MFFYWNRWRVKDSQLRVLEWLFSCICICSEQEAQFTHSYPYRGEGDWLAVTTRGPSDFGGEGGDFHVSFREMLSWSTKCLTSSFERQQFNYKILSSVILYKAILLKDFCCLMHKYVRQHSNTHKSYSWRLLWPLLPFIFTSGSSCFIQLLPLSNDLHTNQSIF